MIDREADGSDSLEVGFPDRLPIRAELTVRTRVSCFSTQSLVVRGQVLEAIYLKE